MPMRNTTKKPRKVTYPISFRVDNATLGQLEKGAARYGMSVHEYARQRLVELLEKQDETRLLEAAGITQRGVERLRSDVATALEVILLNTTPSEPERIRDWINRYLRQPDEDDAAGAGGDSGVRASGKGDSGRGVLGKGASGAADRRG